MIARRRGDHAPGLLRGTELHQLVVGTTDLEGKGRLQVLALEQDLIAQQGRQRRRHLQRRAHRQVVDRGGQDLLHVVLKQSRILGLARRASTHGCLLGVYKALETEKQNPPLGRVWVQPCAIPPNEEWR